MEIEYVPIKQCKPYKANAKKHPPEQVEHIANSIREFGWQQPLVIDKDGVVVIGHGRLLAAKKLGMKEVPCVRAEGLTDEQIKALRLADNKTNESEWDIKLLAEDMGGIFDIDMTQFGFEELPDTGEAFFNRENRNDDKRQEGNDEYNEFLDKFEQPKTTDDCYTPENVYDAVVAWVRQEYNLPDVPFVRPFYPGGDYQRYKYSKDCVVVDNPPFSILSQIVDFYVKNDISFFLFAPALAVLNYVNRKGVCAVCTQNGVTYENGAIVATSFLTNLGNGSIAAYSAPDLFKAVDEANDINEKARTKSLPKYEYPDELITGAKLGWLGKYGQHFVVARANSTLVRALDAMKETGQGIYGNGLLMSSSLAAERAAAERAAATKWELSDREKAIVARLEGNNGATS